MPEHDSYATACTAAATAQGLDPLTAAAGGAERLPDLVASVTGWEVAR